jgi:hypothetical protein
MKLFVASLCAVVMSAWALPLQADLIHHYTFEESSGSLVDQGTNNTPLTLLNGTQRVAGGIGPASLQSLQTGAVSGSGNDFKAGVFSSSGVSTLTGTSGISGLTYSAWVNPTSLSGTSTVAAILRGGSGTTNQARASFGVLADGSLRFGGRKLDADSFQSAISTATGLVALNTWTHIAAVVNYDSANATNGSVQLYVNGLPIATNALSGAWGTGLTTSSTNSAGLAIGSNNPAAATDSEPFNGLIDNLRVYNTALDNAAILNLYQAEVIPEPGTVALAVLAGVGLIGWQFKKRR